MTQQWSNGLFSIGECGTCLYSWFCTPCALASTRTNYDSSNCVMNFCCGSAPLLLNIIREGYNIEGGSQSVQGPALIALVPCTISCFFLELFLLFFFVAVVTRADVLRAKAAASVMSAWLSFVVRVR